MNGLIIYALLMLFIFTFGSLLVFYMFLTALKNSLIDIRSLRDDLSQNNQR